MAIRITRVYTKRGDTGETDLVGGVRASKGGARLESYGAGDDANAAIGVVREAWRAKKPVRVGRRIDEILRSEWRSETDVLEAVAAHERYRSGQEQQTGLPDALH